MYLYLEHSARINGKPRRVWQKYLGPEERFEELSLSGLVSKHGKSLEISTFNFGVSAALLKMANLIGLPSIIDAVSEKRREQGLTVGEYITIAAINRCCKPVSKNKLGKWFAKDWISTNYDVKPETLNAQTYWNHFQYLNEDKLQEIEIALNKVVIEKFNLDLDTLFYDPTNFFTFSAGNGENGLLQFGHSKENRNGNRLVNYTLLCARESGIPLMHKTYPGNENDSTRFKSAPEEIKARLLALNCDPSQVTLVFDKGNHSKEAFKAIDENKFGFIASVRNSTQKDLLHVPRKKLKKLLLPTSGKRVEFHKEMRKVYGVERTMYVVLDPKKHKKHAIHFKEKLEEKIKYIEDFFKERLNVKKWRDERAVAKKINAMIGKNPFKDIVNYSLAENNGKLSLHIEIDKEKRDAHIETLGRSVLFTNCHDWSPESVIWGYREQYVVEHAFKKMKSPTSISIRPMYHYTDRSIRIHVYVCVLGLLLLSLLRLTLSRKKVLMSYNEILEYLEYAHALKIKTSKRGKAYWKLDDTDETSKMLIKKLKLTSLL